MYRNLDLNQSIIPVNSSELNRELTLPLATTPGAQFREALALGVLPDLGTVQSMFDDDANFSEVDPHADIRTDWRLMQNMLDNQSELSNDPSTVIPAPVAEPTEPATPANVSE